MVKVMLYPCILCVAVLVLRRFASLVLFAMNLMTVPGILVCSSFLISVCNKIHLSTFLTLCVFCSERLGEISMSGKSLIRSLQSFYVQDRSFELNWGDLHICSRGTLLTLPLICLTVK